jgi:2-octaprenyl-6-methoxyphenol hydroxylase
VLTLAHSLPHADISTEFHTEEGPFTQVPLPGNRSSLVWVVRPENADRIMNLSAEALNEAVEQRMESILGAVTVDSPLQRFPLAGIVAETAGKGPVLLVGEAAHLYVAELDNLPAGFVGRGDVEAAVARYERARRSDIAGRTRGVDLLNRSLLTGFLPVQFARAAGLSLLAAPGPIRQLALREGMLPGSALAAFGGRLREKIRRKGSGRNAEEQQRDGRH